MDNLRIGEIITTTQHRDAVHMAIAPVVAGHQLQPGQRVAMTDGKAFISPTHRSIGIVDPFLDGYVDPNERFWLFLYPGSITSLRHHWEHPSLADDMSPRPESEVWLREFAEECGLGYQELMGGAEDWVIGGQYLCCGSLLEGRGVPDAFWGHYEAVTGKRVPSGKQHTFFSCSC